MASFNKVMLMGNLTRDPQVKHLPSTNMVVAEFGLAVSRRYRTAGGEDKEEVAFVDCAAFGRQAETIGQFCTKGKPLFVEGRLKFDTWEDKMTHAKRSKLTVVVENFQFIGARQDAIEFPEDMFAGSGAKAPAPAQGRTSESRDEAPSHRGQGAAERTEGGNTNRGPRGRRPQPTEPPFSGEKQFEEADIPF